MRTLYIFLFLSLTMLLSPHHSCASRTVRAAIFNFKPLVYSDTDGSARGFFVKILNHVALKENWSVQYVPGTWQEGMDRLKNNQVDLLVCIGNTEERDKFLDFPKEYLVLDWGVIYKAKGSNINNIFDLEGKTVSVLKGSVYPAGFQELTNKFHIKVTIKEMSKASDVLASVVSGKADAAVAPNLSGILNEEWQHVERTPIIFTPVKQTFGVSEGKNGDLIAALDNQIAALKADRTSVYYQELERLMGKTESKILKKVYLGIFCVFAALLIAISWNIILKRRVNAKTEHLEAEIAERKRIEESLKESEFRWKFALEGAGDGLWDWNIQTGGAYYSRHYKEMLGYSDNEMSNSSDEWVKRIHPDDAPTVFAALEPYLAGKTGTATIEYRMLCKDGSLKAILGRGMVVSYDSNGKPLRMIGTNSDLTMRRQAEEALASSERFLKAIIDTEPECIKLLDIDGNLLMMNGAGLAMIDADSFEQVKGQCVNPLITDSYRAAFTALTKQVFQGIPGTLEFEIIGLKGRHVWLETHAVPFRNEQGDIVSLLGITRDITESRHAIEVSRIRESHYRTLFNNTLIGVAVTDENFKFTEVNDAFCNMVEYSAEELIGKMSIADVSYPEDADKSIKMVKRIMKREIDHYSIEKRYLSKTGKIVSAMIYINAMYNPDGDYLGSTGSILDITELKQAEEGRILLEKQLLHAQKLESLGVLAGGIAHDFNNILMTIVGNADLALMKMNPESPSIENLHKIEQAAARAADLALLSTHKKCWT